MVQIFIDTLDRFFVEITMANLFGWACLGIVFVCLRLNEMHLSDVKKIIAGILFYVVMTLQVCLFVLLIYIFSENWVPPKPKAIPNFSSHVLPATDWVKEKVLIHFIANNELIAIKPNGEGRETVFRAPDAIRKYHFSPDGRYILIVTEENLFQYDRLTKTVISINALGFAGSEKSKDVHGVIDGIRWSPDSKKYCYRISKWSKYAAQERWSIYDIDSKENKFVKSPNLKIDSLEWDVKGENLYYSKFKVEKTGLSAIPYQIRVYKISLAKMEPEFIINFFAHKPSVSHEDLTLWNIDLFVPPRLSFGQTTYREESWYFDGNLNVGIDEEDYLYVRKYHLRKKRLYKISRVPVYGDIARYQYRGGELAVKHLRWLPSGRYIIMEHHIFGVLILESSTGKVGILVNEQGNAFGWHKKIIEK